MSADGYFSRFSWRRHWWMLALIAALLVAGVEAGWITWWGALIIIAISALASALILPRWSAHRRSWMRAADEHVERSRDR